MCAKSIQIIPPNPLLVNQHQHRRLRVAAYCRVSTELEEQESSFEGQVTYYTNLIESNPEWEMAGIYADDGISAVQDTNRPGFMRLIEDCKKGKIDFIYTKSISRFSRNTLDAIKYIRLLKSMGIYIEFEKEGLNTGELSSEIYLTWFSAFAQAESESISQNVTMGIRRRFQDGKFPFPYAHLLGYKKGADGKPEIEEEGAQTIRHIFYSYLAEKSVAQIKAELESDHRLTPTGENVWSISTIQNILRNEKYCGDVLLQKTYTKDFISKTVLKNDGTLQQVYITDNHPAIIQREIFKRVQLEKARRTAKRPNTNKKTKTGRGKHTGKFALSDRLVCGECGSMYRRTMWIKRDGTKESVWRCINRLEKGTKYCKNSPSLKEPVLHQAILNCIQSSLGNTDEVILALKEAEKQFILYEDIEQNLAPMQKRIQEIDTEMSSLLLLAVHSQSEDQFDNKFRSLTQEKAELQSKLDEITENASSEPHRQKQLEQIFGAITPELLELTEFDDDFIRRIVQQITVLSAEKIELRFLGGYCQIGDIPK